MMMVAMVMEGCWQPQCMVMVAMVMEGCRQQPQWDDGEWVGSSTLHY